MSWTLEKTETVPEIYRDFMLVLKPIVDSRRDNPVLKITGIPFGMMYDKLGQKHDVDTEQVEELAHNLRTKNLIEVDNLGFYSPTAEGEDFILTICDTRRPQTVPPFPDF